MRPGQWIAVGSVLAGLAVAAGAFGAHGLSGTLAARYRDAPPKVVAGLELPAGYKYLGDWKTAAEYQLAHALAILAVGLLGLHARGGGATAAGWCFLLGILLFSGSLYGLVLTGRTWLGAVTPIGGVLFLVGWLLLAVAARRVNDGS